MRPSEATNADQYLRLLQAKRSCPTCKPLLEQMAKLNQWDNESILIRRMTTAHNCPGTDK